MTRIGSFALGLLLLAGSTSLAGGGGDAPRKGNTPPPNGLAPAIDAALGNDTSSTTAPVSTATAAPVSTATKGDETGETTAAEPTGRRHQVKSRRETAWGVARQYGVTTPELMLKNGLPAGDPALQVGQWLEIPEPGARRTLVVDLADGPYHWAQEGDSPLGLCRRYGVELQALIAANQAAFSKRSHLLAGHLVKLPPGADTARAECVGATPGPCVHGHDAPGAVVAERPAASTAPVATSTQPVTQPASTAPVATSTRPTKGSTPAAEASPVAFTAPVAPTAPASSAPASSPTAADLDFDATFASVDAPAREVEPTVARTAPTGSPWDTPNPDSPWDRARAERGGARTTATTPTTPADRGPSTAMPPATRMGRTLYPPSVEWRLKNISAHTLEMTYSFEGRTRTFRLGPNQEQTLHFRRGGRVLADLTFPGVNVRPFRGELVFEDGFIYGHQWFIRQPGEAPRPNEVPNLYGR